MKYFLFIFIFVISCAKHRLKQPCTMSFSTSFVPSEGQGNKVYAGTISIQRITFTGEREEGGNVEIEMETEVKSYSLDQLSNLGLSIDIPVGVYKSYEVKIRLSDNNAMELIKNSNSPVQKPMVMQFDDEVNLIFKAKGNSPELKKNNTYNCKLIWDYNVLFAGINGQSWANAVVSNVQGEEKVIINQSVNKDLLEKIKANLSHSLKVQIE